ncbi:MAG: glycosyltransferase family 2 protein, partial [Bdellovibrionales bacterium]|nr:glycosyltransferase family 2 protein [Bdellovibrionales bacterium]
MILGQAGLTSVMTCTADMVGTLPHTIESVFAQSDPEFELLVLDDGSTDGTWEYLQRVVDTRLRAFRFKRRRGLTAARNFLLAQCRGEFVSIADADDYLAPTKLERHKEILQRQPQVGMVWGRALLQRENACGIGAWTLLPPLHYKTGWDITVDYQA